MHTALRLSPTRLLSHAAIAVALALPQSAAIAAPIEFAFKATLSSPMVIGLWYDDLQSGGSSAMGGALPTPELAALRAANPVLQGTFGWESSAAGQHAPWGSTYAGALGLTLQLGGTTATVAHPAATVTVVNDGGSGDTVAVTWNTWPHSFESGLLDVVTAQPQDTRLELNTHFSTGMASLPLHVSYGDLHLAQIQLRLDDSSGRALASPQLPSALSLASFDTSAFDLTFVGLVSSELREEDFASAEDFSAAQAWVQANVRFTNVQVSFTGLPYAALTELTPLRVSSVPEPTSGALAVLGMCAVLGAARRRTR